MATEQTQTNTLSTAASAGAATTAAEPRYYCARDHQGHVDEVPVTATAEHGLLRHQSGQSESEPSVNSTGVPTSLALRLYVSHFLSTWNSRVFEFGAALFLASIFPGTLLPVSIYSLVRNAGYIVFAQPVGTWINTGNRLNVVRASIVGQRVPVAASCALFLTLLWRPDTPGTGDGIFIMIIFLAVVEKLCSTMNLISVERDWVRVCLPNTCPGI